MKNKITELQNQKENKKKTAAFQEIYFEAKKWVKIKKFSTWILVFINIILVCIDFFTEILQNFNMNILTGFVQTGTVIILLVDELYFKSKISSMKEKAAKLQQEFDYTVYGLKDEVFLEKTHETEIEEYSEKYLKRKGGYDKVNSWYSDGIENLSQGEAIMRCQKANYLWDKDLRIKYNKEQLLIMIYICVGYFILLLAANTGIMDIFSKHLFVISPLLLLYLSGYLDNEKTIKTATQLIDACNKVSTYKISSAII
ncbi:MAG: S-4TM family putative pore-forming effector, partial [Fusobacteriaceae bacterium]